MQRGEEVNRMTRMFAPAHEGGEKGSKSWWLGGVWAYSGQKGGNWQWKRETSRKIGAYYSPHKGIVIEGLVPMAIAISMCVCVCRDCTRALRLHGDEAGRGHSEPEPPGALKRRRISDRHYCLLACSLCLTHHNIIFHFFPPVCFARMYRPWSFKATTKKFSELKKQFHLWLPWPPCWQHAWWFKCADVSQNKC